MKIKIEMDDFDITVAKSVGHKIPTWSWLTSTMRFAHSECTPHSKPRQGNTSQVSLSGHTCLEALCSVAVSQVGY